MPDDLEIARRVRLRPIGEIAARAGIPAGRARALRAVQGEDRVRFHREPSQDRPDGALVLVTGINPTPAGEGKTTTTIGLGDALNAAGRARR